MTALRLVIGCLLLSIAASAQDRRKVTEPSIPASCITLTATNLWPLREDSADTTRIQSALDHCPAGHAVELKASGLNDSFLSGPLQLRKGVTLLIDAGVTLYASRNPVDFALRPGSCGIITEAGHGCRALLNGDHVSDAAIMGEGVIDGRGGAKMLGAEKTWWQLADDARKGGNQNNPRLLELNACDNFTLYRVTLRNSPNFHVSFHDTDGFTAWGLKIHSPKRARNSDGIDPANSTNVSILYSWIDTGDDNVAIKAGAGRPTTNITIAHNHFYSGHGMSIGSETDGGASAIRVSDLTVEGADNAIRIKSNISRGGWVHDVVYEDVCIRETQNPILFDTHYTPLGKATGLIPRFDGITLRNVHINGAGQLQFDGYDVAHPLGVTLDHVSLSDPAGAKLIVKNASSAIDLASFSGEGDSCAARFAPFPSGTVPLRVTPDGSADFKTVLEAVNAATPGATILIAPGVYRERITITTANVTMRGAGSRPDDTVIVNDASAGTAGGTFRSATVDVEGTDFHASNLTISNDFNRTHEQQSQGSQAVALRINGDRAVLRHVRFLGNQDTLYAATTNCNADTVPCPVTRQYFADCYIEGNVDFIFGDAKAYFDRCTINSTAHSEGYITAQSKHYPEQDSGFVFRDCSVTASPGAETVWLGRPWRRYATVILLNTKIGSHLQPAGWREWHPGETDYLPTTYYAEYNSPATAKRDPHTHILTEAESRQYLPGTFLGGHDNWNPESESPARVATGQ